MKSLNVGVSAALVLCFFVLSPLVAAPLAPAPAPPLTPAAAEKERLVAEILALDTRLALLQREQAQAEERIKQLTADLNGTAQEKERLTRQAAGEQENVALWLRFLAEDGTLTYLDVLLGAADFSDFLTRLDLVLTIIESNVDRLEQLKALAAAVAAKEEELAQKQAELAQAHAAISRNLATAQELRRAKAGALAEAEKKLADFATLLAVSQAWETVLPDIDRLLSRLEAVPWERVQPDSLEVNYLFGQAHLAYREATLAGLLQSPEDASDSLELTCLPGRLTLTRPAAAGRPAYTLSLELAPDGRRLMLKPAGIRVAGADVPTPTLALLFAGRDLALTLPLPAGLKISRAEVETGALKVTLTRA
ncbi:hypothetical protein [Gelria sp. Kuro-4]|uniref:coiled-coil domain-containing protein n=1 Tax=Gelria sp. Kuro-4 TaxID=2796927 RepID=UPI001BEFF1FD|nr:hypothetical protein [Gelria sp. Kuro-4]BCV25710.1 hypothetical protein kuro4_24830 [Gelria sp. Kuro-4]